MHDVRVMGESPNITELVYIKSRILVHTFQFRANQYRFFLNHIMSFLGFQVLALVLLSQRKLTNWTTCIGPIVSESEDSEIQSHPLVPFALHFNIFKHLLARSLLKKQNQNLPIVMSILI